MSAVFEMPEYRPVTFFGTSAFYVGMVRVTYKKLFDKYSGYGFWGNEEHITGWMPLSRYQITRLPPMNTWIPIPPENVIDSEA